MDPSNPRILYASSWEAIRGPYYMSSGGEDSKIFRSFDGGTAGMTSAATPACRRGRLRKVGLAASGPQPGRLWAMVEHEDGAVYRSDDFGATWEKGSEDRNLRQRAWYYHHIYADTTDEDTVWVLNVEMWKSIDAGKTFQQVSAPHGDNHDLDQPARPQCYSPRQRRRRAGDAQRRQVLVEHLQSADGRMYHVTVDNQFPYRVYGAQQDNTTMSVPSRGRNVAIIFPDWKEIGGGESGYIAVDPEDSDIIYAGAMSGIMTRYDQDKEHTKSIDVWPRMMMGHGAEDLSTVGTGRRRSSFPRTIVRWSTPAATTFSARATADSPGRLLART
ncbi:MAG: hypothetical protein R2849_06465 [Thermomicrobiales bacterium]